LARRSCRRTSRRSERIAGHRPPRRGREKPLQGGAPETQDDLAAVFDPGQLQTLARAVIVAMPRPALITALPQRSSLPPETCGQKLSPMLARASSML